VGNHAETPTLKLKGICATLIKRSLSFLVEYFSLHQKEEEAVFGLLFFFPSGET